MFKNYGVNTELDVDSKILELISQLLGEFYNEDHRDPLGDLEKICNPLCEKDRKMSDSICGGTIIPVNSYPFGRHSQIVYPDSIIVNIGKRSFENGLKEIAKHADKKISAISDPVFPKHIILFTDKWDTVTYRRYKYVFESYKSDHISVIVILLTDYGYTLVPLP